MSRTLTVKRLHLPLSQPLHPQPRGMRELWLLYQLVGEQVSLQVDEQSLILHGDQTNKASMELIAATILPHSRVMQQSRFTSTPGGYE